MEKKFTFKTAQLGNKLNWSKYRYTIDYEEDFRIKKIVEILNKNNTFGNTQQIVDIIDKELKEKIIDQKFSFGYGWKKINFLFRCDAGEINDIGTGHVIVKTLRLIEELIVKKVLLPDQITIVYKNFNGYTLAKKIIQGF